MAEACICQRLLLADCCLSRRTEIDPKLALAKLNSYAEIVGRSRLLSRIRRGHVLRVRFAVGDVIAPGNAPSFEGAEMYYLSWH